VSEADETTRKIQVNPQERPTAEPETPSPETRRGTPAPAVAENDSFAERSRRRLGQTFAAAGASGRPSADGQQKPVAGPPPGPSPAQRVDRQSGAPTTSQPVVTGSQQAVGPTGSTATTGSSAPVPRRPPVKPRSRRARLTAIRVDPWSVMKTAFMLSIAWGIMTLVAVLLVWNVLNASGVFESINSTVSDVLGNTTTTKFDVMDYVGLQRVAGVTTLICVVDVVLITALATLGAFLYNLSASLLGGVEVTLAEED
jgi:Transmembrane domain of unknown function (DUF3566)